MKKAQLVFVPAPAIGHLTSIIEFANCLLNRSNDAFSITVLVILPPYAPEMESSVQSVGVTNTRIRYIVLPKANPDTSINPLESPEGYISRIIELHKSYVEDAIVSNVLCSDSGPVCGLILDMFCSSMVDVGRELGISSFIFFTSGVSFLGLLLSLLKRDDKDRIEFKESDPDADFLGHEHPVPACVFPPFLFNKDGATCFRTHARNFKETKGIIVNSFTELEPYAIKSVESDGIPPIFTLGPLLNLQAHHGPAESVNRLRNDGIMKWLDDQPEESVVFLCFGSVGSFSQPQMEEIALGLERSGHRFLWSLRKPPPKGKFGFPSEFDNYEEIMPGGCIERTKNRGLLCGWAPQIQVLAHKSIGGFMSHCGWNSILESLWNVVPIVTWPMYAEQQPNAFQMVKDLGLAVEMRLDYRLHTTDLVSADEIAKSVMCVMDAGNEVRRKVKEMSRVCGQAVIEGGSSFESLGYLIDLLLADKS